MHIKVFAVALAMAAPAAAHDYTLGALHIDHPVIRVASPQSKTGAGFMTIRNSGKTADRLVAVETAVSTRADLHGTVMKGNVMQMREQKDGIAVPAGGSVTLAPGGLHVMFIGLKAPVPQGALINARLRFERAGAIDIKFKAEPAAGATHTH